SARVARSRHRLRGPEPGNVDAAALHLRSQLAPRPNAGPTGWTLLEMAQPNHSLIALFRELAQLTVLDEGSPNAFRVRAYENALEAIATYRGDLASLTEKQLTAIDGIG